MPSTETENTRSKEKLLGGWAIEEDGGIDLISEFVQQAVKHLTVKLGQERPLLKGEVKL